MAGGPGEQTTYRPTTGGHAAHDVAEGGNTMSKIVLLAAVAALGLATVRPASSAEDIMKYAINKPSTSWTLYGPGQTNSYVKDKAVAGGGGLRVQVATAAPDKPWTIGASQAVQGKITKGDVLMVAFYAKAEPVDGGQASGTVSAVRIQQAAEPWGGIVEGTPIAITGSEWKIYTSRGRATIDADKGQASVSLQLAGARQTLVLGPLFVLDFGADYDPKKFE